MQTGRPLKIYADYDSEGPQSIHDLQTFKSYCLQVAAVVKSHGERGACTGDIHRKLGYELQRYTQTALDSLGLERSWTIPTRYKFTAERRIPVRRFNGQRETI